MKNRNEARKDRRREVRPTESGRAAPSGWFPLVGLALLATLAPGCDTGNTFPNVQPMSPAMARKFEKNCMLCHGKNGQGNGPHGQSLPVRPHDWTELSFQRTLSDSIIRRIVIEGGEALGKSPDMPAFPHLKDSPELAEYVNAVRSFALYD